MLTILIIAITTIVSIIGFAQHNLFDKARFYPYYIHNNREYWRWISGGFIHADYFHLAVNMLTLFFFGPQLESYFFQIFGLNGEFLYAAMYVIAIPVSSMYSYYRHQNDIGYAAIGASGAVSAILFSFILFDPTSVLRLYFAIPIPAWLFGILYLFYSWSMSKKQLDNIGHDAHFFGALFGIIFTILIKPDILLLFIQHFTGQ
ncbi:MAG: rhomboid family intramembrane serine protease [bacterium]|nr:rhomboid family intramembrane serine protease [bacterium]